MILTCSQCMTQFSISAGALGSRGRKVKCSRCSHTWFQAPETPPVSEDPPPLMEVLNREPEAVSAPSSFSAAAPASPPVAAQAGPVLKLFTVFMILLMAGSGLLAALPKLKFPAAGKMSQAIGLADTSGFTFEAIGIKSIPASSGKMSLVFSGAVKNSTAITRPSPVVTVILYDRSGRKVRALEYQFPVAKIGADNILVFEPKVNNIPDSLSRVVLELGNPIEQLLR